MAIDPNKLRAELDGDPRYNGLSDIATADLINLADRTRNLDTLTATEIIQSVDLTELSGLDIGQKVDFWGLLGMAELDPFGKEATLMIGLFGIDSNTIGALKAARTVPISRAQEIADELGVGVVREGDVKTARAI